MAEALTAGIYYDGPAEGYGYAEAALPGVDGPRLVWHPLIPLGQFDHPTFGPFEVTIENLQAMEANFRAGLPTSRGIPIDEDGRHEVRGDGAYGWVRDLAIRDGWLQGGIEWTPTGLVAVGSGELPYVSAHFFLTGMTDNAYQTGDLIVGVALCTRPFFWNQPELQVAASLYRRRSGAAADGINAGATETAPPEGGKAMSEETVGQDEILETEEENADLAAGGTDEGGAEDGGAETEDTTADTAGLQATIDEQAARIEELEGIVATVTGERDSATAQLADLTARVGTLERDVRLEQARTRIAATAVGEGVVLAPAAVEVMACVEVDPTPANQQALTAHLLENGGKLLTVPVGEKPGLTASAPNGGTAAASDDEFFAGKTPKAVKDCKQIMATSGCSAAEAYKQWIDNGMHA